MVAKARIYDDGAVMADSSAPQEKVDPRLTIGYATITQVTRHTEAIQGGGDGTIGQTIDEMLKKSAMVGEEILKVEFSFSEETWMGYSEVIRQKESQYKKAW